MIAVAGLFSLALCLSFTGNHAITKVASQPKVNVKKEYLQQIFIFNILQNIKYINKVLK